MDVASARSRIPIYHNVSNVPYILSKEFERERDRLRRQHAAIKSMLRGRCVTATPSAPRIIIDLGCGTGAVTDELATAFPHAEAIYWVDITPVEPSPSRDRRIEFIEGDMHEVMASDTRLTAGTVDFVYSRLLIYSIIDWPAYIESVFNLLSPGGVLEIQEFCDQFYLPAGPVTFTSHWEWLYYYREGARRKGMDLDCGANVAKLMQKSGFEDVRAHEYKMPYYLDHARPELAQVAELLIDDPDGMFWHAFPRMVQGMDLSADRISELQRQMARSLGEAEGKYQTYWVVTGRKRMRS